TKAQHVIGVAIINAGEPQFLGGYFIELVVGQQFDNIIAGAADVAAHLNVDTVFVAGEHQEHVVMFFEDLLVDLGAIVGEGCPAPVGVRGWFAVRVGHDHGVAVGVLVQYFGGPVEFFLGHVKAQVDGHKVQATGGEQVVVVLVVALAPRGVGGLGVLPSGGLFQGFVAVGVEVLVVQVVGTNIGARAVVVVAGQHPVHDLGVIQNLLRL